MAPASQVLFVNLDGAAITRAADYDPAKGETPHDDAAQNTSSLIKATIPPFDELKFTPGATQRIMDRVRRYLREFDIDVVTTRPVSQEPYTMVVVGGNASAFQAENPASVLRPDTSGIAAFDCDNRNKTGVGFAFADGLRSYFQSDVYTTFNHGKPATEDDIERSVAVTIVHEAGHTFGLAHIDVANSIMHYWINNIVSVGNEDWLAGPVIAPTPLLKACWGPNAALGTNFDPRAQLLTNLGPHR